MKGELTSVLAFGEATVLLRVRRGAQIVRAAPSGHNGAGRPGQLRGTVTIHYFAGHRGAHSPSCQLCQGE